MTAPIGPTNPDAGVIEARPAIDPVTIPTKLGFPNLIHSMNIHTKMLQKQKYQVTSMAIPHLGLQRSAATVKAEPTNP